MGEFSKNIGKNIRKVRTQKGMTLKELAKKCNCSSSMLSQTEKGSLNPSLSTLKSISEALDISIALILEANAIDVETRMALMKNTEQKILLTGSGAQFRLLSRSVGISFEFIRSEWPPGSSTGSELYTHKGEECGILLEGELTIETIEGKHKMAPGDTVTLKSSLPHRIFNSGDKPAIAHWVNSVPWVFTTL